MKKNKDFSFDLKFEDIPVFKGKKLSLDDIKNKLNEMDHKFN